MTEVIVERHPEQPLTSADATAIIEGGQECRAIHRLTWHRSLLSADGQRMVCHLTSPDLESVRIALKSGPQLMKTEVWACTVRDAPGLTQVELGQANVLVSFCFEQPMTPGELEVIEGYGGVCLQSHRVRVLRAFIASDRRRVLCLCLAADAESVRLALRDAAPPCERICALQQFYG
jgi:hypothetical protein